MAAAPALDQALNQRAEQLQQLRKQIAAVSGRDAAGPASDAMLAVPESLVAILPGGLPRGTVAVLSGARSLALSMVAAVTAAGGNAALVGQPDAGLLAAAEMGADLSRLAVIPDPGADPVEVAAVLIDGMDLVVLNVGGGRPVSPARTRAVTARARRQGCTLLVTGGDWPGASLRLDARVRGYETTTAGAAVPGYGRIGRVRIELCARRRA